MNKNISVINSIEVPEGFEDKAVEIRDCYVEYFKKKPGFISSTFYRTINPERNKFNFVNVVVWDPYESFEAVVNSGFDNEEGLNEDHMKVGKGFPHPIKVSPGQFEVIREDKL